jgi:hypothetical protein
MHAVAVKQPGPRFGQVAMPNLVGVFAHLNALGLAPAIRVEQAEFDGVGSFRKKREIQTS